MSNNILTEFGTIQKAQGFTNWLNGFQERNCKGCKYFTLDFGDGMTWCEWVYTKIENGICLDRESAIAKSNPIQVK